MTKLDKLFILVMEELENKGFYYTLPIHHVLKIDVNDATIYIRFSNSADCIIVNDELQEFNEAVLYDIKNERNRLITTGAIMNTFNRINNVLAERYLERAREELRRTRETSDIENTENVSRETSDSENTENVSCETSGTENVSRETSYTADTGNYTQESAITPIITPRFTDEEINNELSRVEMQMKYLLYKELKHYSFNYRQYKRYHIAQVVLVFTIDDNMYTIDFVTKRNSLDGVVSLRDSYTDEILSEKEYLCFNIANYHKSICSIFYHLVRKVKRTHKRPYTDYTEHTELL